jgi:hypothetical protein
MVYQSLSSSLFHPSEYYSIKIKNLIDLHRSQTRNSQGELSDNDELLL